MLPNSEGPSLRGQKEIIHGQVVDQQGFHVDEKTLEAAILKAAKEGKTHTVASSDEPDGPDTIGKTDTIDGELVSEAGFHLNRESLLSNISSSMGLKAPTNNVNKGKSSSASASIDLGMYQPIWEELQKVPFSDNFEQEVSMIAKAIKEASMSLKVKRIIANTQNVAKNAQKFYYSNDGMRVIFSILGNKFSMAAKGDFTGMEAFYIQVNGDTLDGVVLRKEADGDFKDVTQSYKIEIKRV